MPASHRPGEQVGEEAQAEHPPEHAEQAGDDGEGGRERGVAVGSAHADGGDGGGGHQGGRRLRADGELARGAEHGVDEGRRDDDLVLMGARLVHVKVDDRQIVASFQMGLADRLEIRNRPAR